MHDNLLNADIVWAGKAIVGANVGLCRLGVLSFSRSAASVAGWLAVALLSSFLRLSFTPSAASTLFLHSHRSFVTSELLSQTLLCTLFLEPSHRLHSLNRCGCLRFPWLSSHFRCGAMIRQKPAKVMSQPLPNALAASQGFIDGAGHDTSHTAADTAAS